MPQHLQSALTADERAAFAHDGFVVARQLLSRDEALAIRDTFMDQNRDGPVEGPERDAVHPLRRQQGRL